MEVTGAGTFKDRASAMNADEIVNSIFKRFDSDNNEVFSKPEWPRVVKDIFDLFGAPMPTQDDVDDLFNYLDLNGDERISRSELKVLVDRFLRTVS